MKIKLERKEKRNKVKKIPTIKVGTNKKMTMTLWLLLLTSIAFGVYKNFTAIDQHTIHEKAVIEQRVIDTNKIESFSRNFITIFYSWEHNQKALDQRTEKLKDYLTEELQVLNADMVRTDIPTNSTVESIQFWDIKPIDKNNFDVLFTVRQNITEQDKKQVVNSAYTLTVHLDDKENMVIVKNPTVSSIPVKSNYKPKVSDSDGTVDAKTTEDIDSFFKTFFKLYPKANEKELSYYVNNQALKPINREYQFLELASSNYSLNNDRVIAQLSIKYLDPLTKTIQTFEFNITLQKFDNWIITKCN
ncbi:TPA: conjugal transfer protein [Listeria monocytogenes]|uniref:conjugal transfer protein n=1 Tax=Listeria monocytogenes TaxID=1639 RepID=UPI0013877DF8|nr:conjugal transfer protein [Listeria monocytogenes]EDN9731313.1 conjugal transfer protein [Listeria monocytogenes]MCD1831416.1 conjugal transfer protein [Listeria monocytogenes]MCD1834203.1 conjugal transfer protein [Listeria monocytogenes]MCH5002086.1 conjugal transfer protein [Listeria monocytogenes]MCH5012142.1 conjugal transfer protein [Listeria monocytogenes]